MIEENSFGDILSSLRVKKGTHRETEWTQGKVAKRLNVSRGTYNGWENGRGIPSSEDIENIVNLFDLNEKDKETLYRVAGRVAPRIHNLRFLPNRFFTGRKMYLELLDTYFKEGNSVALTQSIGISGLGGIGKTQLALEYAHRRHKDKVYNAVFWVNAADKQRLEESYVALAQLLKLPERDERDMDTIIQAVKKWLEEHDKWLLILDNADEPLLARSFFPVAQQGRMGHILLTTRSQAIGSVARRIEMKEMEPAEGLLFLLKRAGVVEEDADDADLATVPLDILQPAVELVALLGGLPLALDQAGAYIEETGIPFTDYLQLYQKKRRFLLNSRGSVGDEEHPEAVVVTFELCFTKAREWQPLTADFLHFCAFLQPDAIPEELFQQDGGLKLDMEALNGIMGALRRYSLIDRHTQDKTFSMHRLVQAVLVDSMAPDLQAQWRERVVQALNAAFPEVEFKEWKRCGRLVPHVLICTIWAVHELTPTQKVAELFNKAGTYLRERGRYTEAESLLMWSLSLSEAQWGSEHPHVARCLSNLASLYRKMGRYEEAELFYKQALSIYEQQLGARYPDEAASLNGLALLYWHRGEYEHAEPLYQQALLIYEQHLETEYSKMADVLNNLALLYSRQSKYEKAEALYQQALSIYKQHLGSEHPDNAASLNGLAIVYWRQGKYEKAEPLYKQALAIREHHLGAEHPDTAMSMNNLAIIYKYLGKYEEAEELYKQALAIRRQQLGTRHPSTARSLNDLATLYLHQGRYEEAEPLFQQALSIYEQHLGANHADTADLLHGLADLYREQGKYEEAEELYKQALSIYGRQLGVEHAYTAYSFHGLARLYEQQGKYEEAENMYQQAFTIRMQGLGPSHQLTQETYKAYSAFSRKVGRNAPVELSQEQNTNDSTQTKTPNIPSLATNNDTSHTD